MPISRSIKLNMPRVTEVPHKKTMEKDQIPTITPKAVQKSNQERITIRLTSMEKVIVGETEMVIKNKNLVINTKTKL